MIAHTFECTVLNGAGVVQQLLGYPRATAVRLNVRNGIYGGRALGFAPIVEPSHISKHGSHI